MTHIDEGIRNNIQCRVRACGNTRVTSGAGVSGIPISSSRFVKHGRVNKNEKATRDVSNGHNL